MKKTDDAIVKDKSILEKCKYLSDDINSINLEQKENVDKLEKRINEELKNALFDGINGDSIVKIAALCFAETRLAAAKRGYPDTKVAVDRRLGASASASTNLVTWHLIPEGGIIEFDKYLSKSEQNDKDKDIFEKRLLVIDSIFSISAHEVEHIEQFIARYNLKTRPNEAAALDILETIARRGVLADFYDKNNGHDEFVFEMDADAAGYIYSLSRLNSFLDFCKIDRNDPKYKDGIKKILSVDDLRLSATMSNLAERFGWKNVADKIQETRPDTLLDVKAQFDYYQNAANTRVKDPAKVTMQNYKSENKQMGNVFDYSVPPKKSKKDTIKDEMYYLEGIRKRYEHNKGQKSRLEHVIESNLKHLSCKEENIFECAPQGSFDASKQDIASGQIPSLQNDTVLTIIDDYERVKGSNSAENQGDMPRIVPVSKEEIEAVSPKLEETVQIDKMQQPVQTKYKNTEESEK